MRITGVDCHVLVDPTFNTEATSSAQDDFVVEIHTDEGISGIGESDVNPWIARACIESPGTQSMDRGFLSCLIGANPLDSSAIWRRVYEGTAMAGRRGALIHALGAVEMALWDIRGKAAGVPVWQLLGEAARDRLQAYASIQPETNDFDSYLTAIVQWAARAQALGFTATKLEVTLSGPYANMGIHEPDSRMAEVIGAVRDKVGDDMMLMVDVQYAFDAVERAQAVINSWREFNLFFVEAPLPMDDVEGYSRLARSVDVPIAAGEWLATRYEFRELIERDACAVLQPDPGRVGGIAETLAVCEMAADAGLKVVPHAWKTGISLAAAAHVATVTPNMPVFEFLHPELCESRLRKELVSDEISFDDGGLSLPRRTGLGVELNRDALMEFAAAAADLERAQKAHA